MPGGRKGPAGPPAVGGPDFLEVGKVRRPHGVHGEVMVELSTDFPERLVSGKTVYIGEKRVPLIINSQRSHGKGLLLSFEGLNTPEQVANFRNQILYVQGLDLPKKSEDEFFYHELLDILVVNEEGQPLGELTEIIETGANDVYVVVDDAGRELLLPAIPQVIKTIDLTTRRITVHLLPGLEFEAGKKA